MRTYSHLYYCLVSHPEHGCCTPDPRLLWSDSKPDDLRHPAGSPAWWEAAGGGGHHDHLRLQPYDRYPESAAGDHRLVVVQHRVKRLDPVRPEGEQELGCPE